MYGGGRQGQRREAEEYGESDALSCEKKAKKELESLIKREFAKRSSGREEEEESMASYATVKAASCTSTKVNGLKISVSISHQDPTGKSESVHLNKINIKPLLSCD